MSVEWKVWNNKSSGKIKNTSHNLKVNPQRVGKCAKIFANVDSWNKYQINELRLINDDFLNSLLISYINPSRNKHKQIPFCLNWLNFSKSLVARQFEFGEGGRSSVILIETIINIGRKRHSNVSNSFQYKIWKKKAFYAWMKNEFQPQ